jgi:hypothetical protein
MTGPRAGTCVSASANGHVRCAVADWQPVQGTGQEVRAGHPLPCPGEHLGGVVDAEDLVAKPGQVGGVPAGAARRVERPPGRYLVQDLPHQWLLDVDQRVARLVIGRGPCPVARYGVDLAKVRPFPELGGMRKQRSDLGDAVLGEPAVEPVARVGAQQRDAFQAEQEGQRMPVCHSRRP